jgi:ribonuclease HI
MSWARDTAFDLWHLSHPPNQQKLEKEIPKWRRQEEGWSKVNTDATLSEDSKEGATAFVIRDDQEALQATVALWYERGLDACTMEALACRDGLKLAVQLGLRRVQLESDCLQAVQLWKRKNMQRYILNPILKEMEEISLAFHEFSVSHNSRNYNKVAHCLAK